MPGHRKAAANPPSPLCVSSENLLFQIRTCHFTVVLFCLASFRGPLPLPPQKQNQEDFAAVEFGHSTSGAAFLPQKSGAQGEGLHWLIVSL